MCSLLQKHSPLCWGQIISSFWCTHITASFIESSEYPGTQPPWRQTPVKWIEISGPSESLDVNINFVDRALLTLIPWSISITDAEQWGGEVPACFTLSIPLHEDVGDVVAGALQVIGVNNLGQNDKLKFWNILQYLTVKVLYVSLDNVCGATGQCYWH